MHLSSQFFESLAEAGWAIADDVLPSSVWTAWARELVTLNLRPAAIGVGDRPQLHPDVRSDRISWLDGDAPDAVSAAASAFLDDLRRRTAHEIRAALPHHEAHFTEYPPGGEYELHWDRPPGKPSHRVITFILYLNENWGSADGGELELHRPQQPPCIIEPRGGRLVLFRSEVFPHRVRITRRSRKSLTGWFRDDGPLPRG